MAFARAARSPCRRREVGCELSPGTHPLTQVVLTPQRHLNNSPLQKHPAPAARPNLHHNEA
jgi:hypothetical protein